MVSIVIERCGKSYHRVFCQGHAGYARSGEDIVCASVSILVINTLNAIDRFTDTKYSLQSDDERGYIEAVFEQGVDSQSKLLLDAMVMGLEEVSSQYRRHVSLELKEIDTDQ